jgi:hypothetical protein
VNEAATPFLRERPDGGFDVIAGVAMNHDRWL